jgi:hypothetical protein
MRATKAKGPMAFWTSNNGNHLHILLRSKHNRDFQNFLRTVAGHIAQMVTKAHRGAPKGKFWDALTFTRLGDWQRAYENLKDYVLQNLYEAAGDLVLEGVGGDSQLRGHKPHLAITRQEITV